MGHTWHWQLLQVGLVEKKPLSAEPDQKMAENKVTVIHKIGFKVWNRLLRRMYKSFNILSQDCEIWFVRFSMDKNQKIMALGNQTCVSSTQLIHKLIVAIVGCLSLSTWIGTLLSPSSISMSISIYVSMSTSFTDMRFVKKFTPPNLQAKNFAP